MGIAEILLLAVGLSMDAFAVSVCKGLGMKKAGLKESAIVGLWFGVFQALMPVLGYLLASTFADRIDRYDHWIAFGLLAVIGANMIRESFSGEEEKVSAGIGFRSMLGLAVATSIDALAVGVGFAFVEVNLPFAVSVIGCVTFLLCAVGVRVGNVFGARYEKRATLVGGIILVLLGLKILLEGLGVL